MTEMTTAEVRQCSPMALGELATAKGAAGTEVEGEGQRDEQGTTLCAEQSEVLQHQAQGESARVVGELRDSQLHTHAGTKGELAVDVKHEDLALISPHDAPQSTGAPSDMAQDTTMAAAPVLAAALSVRPGDTAASASIPARPNTADMSSPSSGNDSMPGTVAPHLPALAQPGQLVAPALQRQQQQQQDDDDSAVAQQQQAAAVAVAAVAEEQQQQQQQQQEETPQQQQEETPQQQQQQQQQSLSLGLELLGEAAGLVPQESGMPASAVVAAAAASAAGRKSAAAEFAGRQARLSTTQLPEQQPLYNAMFTGVLPAVQFTVPKPEGVACQVPGCHANLNAAGVSTYFRRHRVCSTHAKADCVPINGIGMRFCQQCGIMHQLADFDGSRKSCRVQLDRHNLRRRCRRKTQVTKSARKANMDSSSRGGGSSVSPSGGGNWGAAGPGGSSPPRASGKSSRAAARAAAAAFAAAAASTSGVTGGSSREHEGEGYCYGDADYMGEMYGAVAGGTYYNNQQQAQQQPGRHTKKSGSFSSMAGWEQANGSAAAAAADTAALGSGYPAYPAKSVLGQLMSPTSYAPSPAAAAAAAGTRQSHSQLPHLQQYQQQQQQGAPPQGWMHEAAAPGTTGGWGMDSAAAATVPSSLQQAPGGACRGGRLTLQQLRLHIASTIAQGQGPGITAIRAMSFVTQLLVVDELTTGLMAELDKHHYGAPPPTAPEHHPAAGGYGGQQQQQQQAAAVGVAGSEVEAGDGAGLGSYPSGSGLASVGQALVDAVAAAGAGGSSAGGGSNPLVSLLQHMSRMGQGGAAAGAGYGSSGHQHHQHHHHHHQQQQQPASGLGSPRWGGPGGNAAGRGSGAVKRVSGEQQQQHGARKKSRGLMHSPDMEYVVGPRPAAGTSGWQEGQAVGELGQPVGGSSDNRSRAAAAAAAAAAAVGLDSNVLRQVMRYASGEGAPAAAAAAMAAGLAGQASHPAAVRHPAASMALGDTQEQQLAGRAGEAAEPGSGCRAGSGEGGPPCPADDVEKSSTLAAVSALLAAAGVKMEPGQSDPLALLAAASKRATGAAASAAVPVGQPAGSWLQATQQQQQQQQQVVSSQHSPHLMAPPSSGPAPGAGAGCGAEDAGVRSARESSSQVALQHAALLRSLASSLPGAGADGAAALAGAANNRQLAGTAARPSGGGGGPGSGAADAGGDGRGGGGPPASPRQTAMLLSSLLQQLAAAKR